MWVNVHRMGLGSRDTPPRTTTHNHHPHPPQFYNGWATSLRVCLEREIALTMRDRSYIAARLLQDLLLGLLTGLIFFNLNIEAVSTRFGAMYQTLLTIAFQVGR